jgi:hypothetical protein
VGDDSHIVFRQKFLGENGSVTQGVVMVKQSGLFSPKLGATSSHAVAAKRRCRTRNSQFGLLEQILCANCCVDGGTSP